MAGRSPLELLPPEISTIIYRDACVDDGATGAALSRTSKTVRQDSSHWRYRFVGIYGPAALVNIVASLNQVPYRQRNVQHLFITDEVLNPTMDPAAIPIRKPIQPIVLFDSAAPPTSHRVETPPEPAPPSLPEGMVVQLLELAWRRLETLCIRISHPYTIPAVAIPFPRLTTLIMDSPVLELEDDYFNSLRHLHIARQLLPYDFLDGKNSELVPKLSLLRMMYGYKGGVSCLAAPHDITRMVVRMHVSSDDVIIFGADTVVQNGVKTRARPADIPKHEPFEEYLSAVTVSHLSTRMGAGMSWHLARPPNPCIKETRHRWMKMALGDWSCCEGVEPVHREFSKIVRDAIIADVWQEGWP